MTTKVLIVNRREIELTRAYSSTWDAGIITWKRCANSMGSYNKCRENTTLIAGDCNDQFRPAVGAEGMSAGQHTLKESNTRGDWVEHRLMIQNYVNDVQTKTTYISSNGCETQTNNWITCLVEERSTRHCTDAKANDMIDMGSDHLVSRNAFQVPRYKEE